MEHEETKHSQTKIFILRNAKSPGVCAVIEAHNSNEAKSKADAIFGSLKEADFAAAEMLK